MDGIVIELFGREHQGETRGAPSPEAIAQVNAVMDRLVEAGMAQWIGNGTDNVYLTPEGVKALEVMLIIMQSGYPDFRQSYLSDHHAEPNFNSVHAYVAWHTEDS
jgi:hypothetical protein